MLSSRAVDGYQMYSGGSSFNNWYRDLAHPSPNFHNGVSKRAKFGVLFNITQI